MYDFELSYSVRPQDSRERFFTVERMAVVFERLVAGKGARIRRLRKYFDRCADPTKESREAFLLTALVTCAACERADGWITIDEAEMVW